MLLHLLPAPGQLHVLPPVDVQGMHCHLPLWPQPLVVQAVAPGLRPHLQHGGIVLMRMLNASVIVVTVPAGANNCYNCTLNAPV